MFWRDHAPPHFHVLYQGFEASVAIASGEVIEGSLPKTARRLVRDWAQAHRAELLANWERGRMMKSFFSVPGADEDD
ncbi:MAG: DUF4160 domain-containing protein [Devosia sp.]|uniref:DUF4160 domain-containing protein n=1 Tax=Devosia sp. TaxID=1871048 RepID=UPI001AC24D3A|nr:DUF4160 domain-containing protein [Devosia sp.]MBN9316481.1 DUF4160 domain-containing protein [Devosia sp.]